MKVDAKLELSFTSHSSRRARLTFEYLDVCLAFEIITSPRRLAVMRRASTVCYSIRCLSAYRVTDSDAGGVATFSSDA